MNRAEVIKSIKNLKTDENLKGYRFGLAGSYARGTNNKRSDIDIVVECDGMPLELIRHIKDKYTGLKVDVDIIFLAMLKEEDAEQDSIITSLGLTINDESIYKNIINDVIWFD